MSKETEWTLESLYKMKEALGPYYYTEQFSGNQDWSTKKGYGIKMEDQWSFSGPGKFTIESEPVKLEPIKFSNTGFKPKEPEWNPRADQCPHCLRPWHAGALTQRVANMLVSHSFDPDYDPEADESAVICVGSDHQGPPRPPVKIDRGWGTWGQTLAGWQPVGSLQSGYKSPQWVSSILQDTMTSISEMLSFKVEFKLWTGEPATPKALVPAKSQVNGEIVQFGKYPVEKVDVYEIDEHIDSIKAVADQFEPFIELPDMKADYDSIIQKFNEENTCGPQSSFAKV